MLESCNHGTYEKKIDHLKHTPSKAFTWRIERKHLTFRTRIKRLTRKTICFSKSEFMHDLAIGLFINSYEFGIKQLVLTLIIISADRI